MSEPTVKVPAANSALSGGGLTLAVPDGALLVDPQAAKTMTAKRARNFLTDLASSGLRAASAREPIIESRDRSPRLDGAGIWVAWITSRAPARLPGAFWRRSAAASDVWRACLLSRAGPSE